MCQSKRIIPVPQQKIRKENERKKKKKKENGQTMSLKKQL